MSDQNLELGGVYICLKLLLGRSSPTAGIYHWGIYHHHSSIAISRNRGPRAVHAGHLWHITQPNDVSTWTPEHGHCTTPLSEMFRVALVRIGKVGIEQFEEVDRTVRAADGRIPEWEGLTCRVYVLAAIERLADAGFVACSSIQETEAEIKALGNKHCGSAEEGVQPRPVEIASSCPLR